MDIIISGVRDMTIVYTSTIYVIIIIVTITMMIVDTTMIILDVVSKNYIILV